MSTLFRPGRTTTNPRAGLELFFIPLFVLERDEGSGTEWGVGQVEDSENWTASGRWMLLLRRVSYRQTRISQALVFVISIYMLQTLSGPTLLAQARGHSCRVCSRKLLDTKTTTVMTVLPSTNSSYNPATLYSLLIKNITVSHSAFRRFFLVLCSFLALPVVNTIVPHYIYILVFVISLFALSPSLIVFFILKRSSFPHVHVSTVLTIHWQLAFIAFAALAPEILMIIATERMVLANNVGAQEGVWTFGQSVVLGVAGLPVSAVVGQVRAMAGWIRERMRERRGKRWKGKAPLAARPRPNQVLPNSQPSPYTPQPARAPQPVPSLPTLYEPVTHSHPGELALPMTSSPEPIVEIPMINIMHHDP